MRLLMQPASARHSVMPQGYAPDTPTPPAYRKTDNVFQSSQFGKFTVENVNRNGHLFFLSFFFLLSEINIRACLSSFVKSQPSGFPLTAKAVPDLLLYPSQIARVKAHIRDPRTFFFQSKHSKSVILCLHREKSWSLPAFSC